MKAMVEKVRLVVLLSAAFLALSANAVFAQKFDFNLGEDAAEFNYILDTGTSLGGTELAGGLLFTTSDDVLAMAGLQVTGDTGNATPSLSAGIGLKVFALTTPKVNVIAVGAGGLLRFSPPSLPRFSVFGDLYYAPKIVTFSDGENLTYFSGGLEYELLSQADVYLGYRIVRTTTTLFNNINVDSGVHVGLRMFL